MRIFVKYTSDYERQATQYGCFNTFERFQKRATSKPGFEHEKRKQYDSFPGNYIKEQVKNFRHIYTYRDAKIKGEDVRCYLWLCVLPRGGHDYDKFQNFRTTPDTRDAITGLPRVKWDLIWQQCEAEMVKKTEEFCLPDLSEEEKAFIQRGQGIIQEIFDTPIYESKQWIAKVRSEKFGDPYKVADAITSKIYESLDYSDEIRRYEIPYGDNDEKILCFHLQIDKKDGWFLLGLGLADELNEIAKDFDVLEREPTFDELAQKCRRAYPLSMLEDDKDFWWEMERDKDSNFILSSEEINVVSGKLTFPLFISGRAGSGKSTMLQYLFAEYFLRYLNHEDVPAPVYLSYSENLITNAKKLATTLFSKNHAYLEKLKEIKKNFRDDVEGKLDKSFFVFQNIVKSCIEENNPSALNTRFASENYISYSRYRELWESKFSRVPRARNEYGPALSWHVIRTYIKGWDSEEILEPEDYSEIGRGNKSVSDEIFRKVYENVWEKWYSKLQEQTGLWDDQDLVRYCLSPDDSEKDSFVSEKFSAIFCDESQDFTRTETDFILRLSIFSNRRVYDENTLFQLPFVFAGDEFQTLNPTGFSWDSLRSYFTERLIHETGVETNGHTPEPIELTRNYRSTAPIVRLANRLQLLRQTRCPGESKKMPQIPYYAEENGASVYCLSPKSQHVWNKLGQMEAVLIIPSADGESPQEFIQRSAIKDYIDFYEDGSPKNITIYNPIQAKGLEYPYVAVYGFDDSITDLRFQELLKWYDAPNPPQDSETKGIDLRYFLSNAYVSATRAKSKLFILSDFSDKSFWAFAFTSENTEFQDKVNHLEQQMMSKVGNQSNWRTNDGTSLLGYILEGNINSLTGDEIINAGEVAKVTEERGMSLHDPGLLRQAAARYRERSKQKDVDRCDAYALWYEQKHYQAAPLFEKSDLIDMAVLAFWYALGSGKNLQAIITALVGFKDKSQRYEITIAEHLKNGLKLNDFKLDLEAVIKIFQGNGEDKDHAKNTRGVWQQMLGDCLNRLPVATPADKNDVDVIISQALSLAEFGIVLNIQKLALMAYAASCNELAVELWEKHPVSQQPKEYYRAKCQLLPYPDNLVFRPNTGDPNWEQTVTADWRNDKSHHSLSETQKKLVANAVVNAGEPNEVKHVLPYLLANALNVQESEIAIRNAGKRKMQIAEDALKALQQARLTDLKNWQMPGVIYESQSLNDLLAVISKIKEVRTEQFEKRLREAIVDKRILIRDFMSQEFGSLSRMMGINLLYTEIGMLMERRGHSLDAQRYYNWVQQQTDDSEFRREMAIRWIFCRERQASLSDAPDDYLPEAIAKRKELEISEEAELEEEPHFDKWQYLFRDILNESAVKKKKQSVKNKPNSQPPSSDSPLEIPVAKPGSESIPSLEDMNKTLLPQATLDGIIPTITSKSPGTVQQPEKSKLSNGASAMKKAEPLEQANTMPKNDTTANQIKTGSEEVQVAKESSTVPLLEKRDSWYMFNLYDGYVFEYNPAKSTLIIKFAPDRLSIKIKHGRFPADGEFSVDNNHLLKIDDDGNKTPTPFLCVIHDNKLELCISESGVSVLFPF